ncbi:hypothetical protein M422DRAFT_271044 [Sphaerobolus stellatus SS14]|uniref:MULE transposase domain-containing protein n=1 Tax=Sphaerobolus stellatus (strain SS14) TaxID=990650 RepID=A0A0C9UR44_SPHS4|nr:hypothetical protein M422DRAFT_271044 [Sphaerobolus stellatus SS14]
MQLDLQQIEAIQRAKQILEGAGLLNSSISSHPPLLLSQIQSIVQSTLPPAPHSSILQTKYAPPAAQTFTPQERSYELYRLTRQRFIDAIVEYPESGAYNDMAVAHRFRVDITDPYYVHPKDNIQYSLGNKHGAKSNVGCYLLRDENHHPVPCHHLRIKCTGNKQCFFKTLVATSLVHNTQSLPSNDAHREIFMKILAFYCALLEHGCLFDAEESPNEDVDFEEEINDEYSYEVLRDLRAKMPETTRCKAIVVARAFITSQSAEAHKILFTRIFSIMEQDTGQPPRFRYIHGTGYEIFMAGGHKGQALGLGMFCQELCRNTVLHAMMSLASVEPLKDLDNTLNIIRNGGPKAVGKFFILNCSPFAFAALYQPASQIPLEIWRASPSTSDGNEQAHRSINRDGIRLTMLAGIMRGMQFDSRALIALLILLEHGIHTRDQAATHYRRISRAIIRSAGVQQRTVAQQDTVIQSLSEKILKQQAAVEHQQTSLKRTLEVSGDAQKKSKKKTGTRDNEGMDRFDCKSSLTISMSRNEASSIRQSITVHLEHGMKHVPYYDVQLPKAAQELIFQNLWASSSIIAAKVQKEYPHITSQQVYRAWVEFTEGIGCQILPVTCVEAVQVLAWGLKYPDAKLAGKVVEVGIGATYNTNAKDMELYAVIAEHDNTGIPLAYCLLMTASSICPGKRKIALESFFGALRDKYQVNPHFGDTRTKILQKAEIKGARNVWHSSKHQLCWWHTRTAVRTRLKESKLGTSPYHVNIACAEYPFIDPLFLPRTKPDHADTEDPDLVPKKPPTPTPTSNLPPPASSPNSLPIKLTIPKGLVFPEPSIESTEEEAHSSRIFCPAAYRDSIIDMMESHLCAHPLIPGVCAPSREGIRMWIVKQMYDFCYRYGLREV